MGENNSTGILLCDLLNGINGDINISEIESYTENLPKVSRIWKTWELKLNNAEKFAVEIKQAKLNRIIIAGINTGFYKSFITEAMVIAGKDPSNIVEADFQEYGATELKDTGRALAIMECAALNVSFESASVPDDVHVHPDTMVIGGGIAGIQAALEIANAGKKVYLVERTGTIGGHMAMFDKTFPTLDCAACILTPKMVEVGQHPNIELITYAEVKGLAGVAGDYKVSVLKKARRVDLTACIGCGICSEKCPSKAPSEFDAGTSMRKSIYIPFPQAVPNKYLIDADSCTYVQKGKCGVCAKVCPAECINLDEKDQQVEINVGNIIVATGFKTFDPEKAQRYGYGKYPNVLTSLEFERMINAAGPTGGNITFRKQDKKGNWIFEDGNGEPKSVALIHCIGSRDENFNKYCSRVCCMYSLKLAHLVKEKIPDAFVYEYFIDMRAYGKGYEEFYERIKDEGVHIIRGRTAEIKQKGGLLLLRSEDILNNRLIEQEVEMAILAVGLEPRNDASELADLLGIDQGENGWFCEAHNVFDTTGTYTGGISIAGACQGPKDIPDSVAQGSAAAARVLKSIIRGKVKKSSKDLTLKEIVSKANEYAIMEEKS